MTVLYVNKKKTIEESSLNRVDSTLRGKIVDISGSYEDKSLYRVTIELMVLLVKRQAIYSKQCLSIIVRTT